MLLMLNHTQVNICILFQIKNSWNFSRWEKPRQTIINKSVSERLFRFEEFRLIGFGIIQKFHFGFVFSYGYKFQSVNNG